MGYGSSYPVCLEIKIRLNVLIALSYLYDHFKEDMKDNEIDLIFMISLKKDVL